MLAESIIVDVAISRDEWLRVYKGDALRARGVARDGRSVVFPVGILQRFMDHDGVYGSFVITYDGEGKFHSIQKIGSLPKSTPSTQLQ